MIVLTPAGHGKEQREVSPSELCEILKGFSFTGAYGRESVDRFYSSSQFAPSRADRGAAAKEHRLK